MRKEILLWGGYYSQFEKRNIHQKITRYANCSKTVCQNKLKMFDQALIIAG